MTKGPSETLMGIDERDSDSLSPDEWEVADKKLLHEESQRQNDYDMVIIRSRRLGVRKPY